MRYPSRSRLPWAWRSGCEHGAAPDRFLVGLATLNLLAEVAEERPLLCLVDDAQWLDQASAQVLAFVARRVAAEQLGVGVRTPRPSDESTPFAGCRSCAWRARRADAQALLAAAVPAPLDDRVRDRIVAEARGNPLALLELPAKHDSRRSWPAGSSLPGVRVPWSRRLPAPSR